MTKLAPVEEVGALGGQKLPAQHLDGGEPTAGGGVEVDPHPRGLEAHPLARRHQVHDLVEDETGDWLVMELVVGRSLRQELTGGWLEPEKTASTRDSQSCSTTPGSTCVTEAFGETLSLPLPCDRAVGKPTTIARRWSDPSRT